MRPPDYCLLGRKKKGVVTDGLVCWIDGADYDLGTSSFVDRVTNSVVPLETYADFEHTETVENGFMHTYHTSYARYGTKKLTFDTPPMTIEFVGGSTQSERSYVAFGVFRDLYGKILNNTMRIGGFGVNRSYSVGTEDLNIPMEDGKIYHLVLSYNDAGANLYINGEMIGVSNIKKFENMNPMGVFVGQPTHNGTHHFGCTRIYDRTLSDGEILQNYNYEKSLGRVT